MQLTARRTASLTLRALQLHLKRRNQLIAAGLQVSTASRPTSSARQRGVYFSFRCFMRGAPQCCVLCSCQGAGRHRD